MISKQNVDQADNESDPDSDSDSIQSVDPEADDLKHMKLAIHKILAEIPSNTKRVLAKNILDIFIRNRKIFSWNKRGLITKPKKLPQSVSKLKHFIKILIYQNKGSQSEIQLIGDVIKPIFDRIKNFVLNKKILKHNTSHQPTVKISKKRLNKKSYITMK